MPKIRAFVGHSFTEQDAEVFRRFAGLFDNLEKVMPEFTWDHAQEAQPISISEKVLGLTSDKNIFVGIYTRKERVLKPPHSPTSVLSRLRFSEAAFEWKTSDWIIQETGMAKGMKLPSIFFVEDGVRPPSGLHNDLEWIPFKRANPDACFGLFMQMISTLMEKKESLAAEPESPTSPPPVITEATPTPPTDGTIWSEPRPEWSRDQYEIAHLHAVASKAGAEQEAKISDAFARSEYGKQPAALTEWQGYIEWNRISLGTGGSIARLRKYSEEEPNSFLIKYYLGRSLETFDQFGDAAAEFKSAAALAAEPARKVRHLGDAAGAYRKAGRMVDANAAMAEARSIAGTTPTAESAFLRKQREFATAGNNRRVLVGTLERLLEIEPADRDVRFALAYLYDERGQAELALYHYLLIPYVERQGGTWNNLGTVQSHLGLHAGAVTSYKRAMEDGESLGGSNLAYKYLEAGFLDDARTVCDAAQKMPNPHKNILGALARIHDIPEEEDKKEEELRKKARIASEFYGAFGRATALPLPMLFATAWKGHEFTLSVHFDGLAFSASADYDVPVNALALAMTRQEPGRPAPVQKYRIEFRGTVWGSAIVGEVTRKRAGQVATILAGSESDYDALIFTSDGGRTMRVLETGKDHRRTYELQAVT